MDFSLEQSAGYEPVRWMDKVKRDLTAAGFDVGVSWNDRKTVHVAWIRVAGLMKEAGLAGLGNQKLSIKLEVDTRPPAGATTVKNIVNRHTIFAARHHDLPSLMAGKIHALTTRRYPKGRDWYDLLWYRAQRPPVEPNTVLLQNALDQTQGLGKLDARNWRQAVQRRLEALDMAVIRADVAPFLERPRDVEWLNAENIRSVMQE
jgi:hypothetical protein